MKYRLVLFDADETLFDFRKGEAICFADTMKDQELPSSGPSLFEDYKKISLELWTALELGQIEKDFLKTERWRRLFEKHGLNGDAKRASDRYLGGLSNQAHLFDDSLATCEALKGRATLGFVTNGVASVQRSRLALSTLAPLFDFMVISEDCGYTKPDRRIFDHALSQAKHADRSSVLMVGDRLEADILGAKNAGIDSVWYNPAGLKNHLGVQPTYEIRKLSELPKIVRG